jgi:hypothetical protein
MSLGWVYKVYTILMLKPFGKRPRGTLRIRDDNIKIDCRKTGCENGKWMEIPQDRFQRRVLTLLIFVTTTGFAIRKAFGVQFLAGAGIFFFVTCSARLWGQSSLLSMGTWGSFHGS